MDWLFNLVELCLLKLSAVFHKHREVRKLSQAKVTVLPDYFFDGIQICRRINKWNLWGNFRSIHKLILHYLTANISFSVYKNKFNKPEATIIFHTCHDVMRCLSLWGCKKIVNRNFKTCRWVWQENKKSYMQIYVEKVLRQAP